MAARAVKLVSRQADPEKDKVFFAKTDVQIGTLLVCVGKRLHGTRWKVVAIHYYHLNQNGDYVLRPSPEGRVRYLNDRLTLEWAGNGDPPMGVPSRMTKGFGGATYSSIWRLV